MRELRPLTPEEFERARYALMNPKPGSRIAAARDYGVDLTLLVEQLRKSPAERALDAAAWHRRSHRCVALRAGGVTREPSRHNRCDR